MLNIAVVPQFQDATFILKGGFRDIVLYGKSIASIAQGPALRSIGKGGFVKPPGFLNNILASKNSIPSCGFYLTLTAKKTAVAVFS